jgi:hypothetical protein
MLIIIIAATTTVIIITIIIIIITNITNILTLSELCLDHAKLQQCVDSPPTTDAHQSYDGVCVCV